MDKPDYGAMDAGRLADIAAANVTSSGRFLETGLRAVGELGRRVSAQRLSEEGSGSSGRIQEWLAWSAEEKLKEVEYRLPLVETRLKALLESTSGELKKLRRRVEDVESRVDMHAEKLENRTEALSELRVDVDVRVGDLRRRDKELGDSLAALCARVLEIDGDPGELSRRKEDYGLEFSTLHCNVSAVTRRVDRNDGILLGVDARLLAVEQGWRDLLKRTSP